MNAKQNLNPPDDDLSTVIDKFERDVARMLRNDPDAIRALLAVLLLLIASPLVVFWVSGNHALGKEWSETVKNAIEGLALIAAAFGVCKWLDERRNRAADVLLSLDKEFKKNAILKGRQAVEDGDYTGGHARSDDLDSLLRFYVVLYGILRARQAPELSLSICFRYWLAHYFRKDRIGFRDYVDRGYPTLSNWLQEDCCQELSFFRPHRLFPETIDEKFIAACLVKK